MFFLKYKSDYITLTLNAFAPNPSKFSFTFSIKFKLLNKGNEALPHWELTTFPTSFQITVPYTTVSQELEFLKDVKFSPPNVVALNCSQLYSP